MGRASLAAVALVLGACGGGATRPAAVALRLPTRPAEPERPAVEFRSLARGELLDPRFISDRARVYVVRDATRAAEFRSLLPIAASEALREAGGPVLAVVPPAQPPGTVVHVEALRVAETYWEVHVRLTVTAGAATGSAAVFDLVAPAEAPPRYFRLQVGDRAIETATIEVW